MAASARVHTDQSEGGLLEAQNDRRTLGVVTRRRTRFETKRRTASRRPGFIPGRRFAFAAVAAAALMGFSAASAAADGGPLADVTVFPTTGPPPVYSVSTSTLTP